MLIYNICYVEVSIIYDNQSYKHTTPGIRTKPICTL